MDPKREKELKNKIKNGEKLPLRKSLRINILLFLITLFFMFPIVWILLMSLKSQDQISSMPPDIFSSFTLENYRSIFNAGVESSSSAKSALMQAKATGFFKGLLNTLIVSSFSVFISSVVGIPAAYGLSRFKNKQKNNLAFMFLSFRFVPELIIIIPLYLIYQKLGLYGTYFGLIWVYILISLPMIIWITRSYFDDLPFELEQAAMLDGHSNLYSFFKIIIPMGKPGIAASVMLSFIYAWNNFIFGFVLAKTNLQPVTVRIMSYYDITDLNYGRIAAAIFIAILPMIIVSQIGSRYLVTGLSMGAVKK